MSDFLTNLPPLNPNKGGTNNATNPKEQKKPTSDQSSDTIPTAINRLGQNFKVVVEKYTTDSQKNSGWNKFATIGVWLYTGLTLGILAVTIYQTIIARETLGEIQSGATQTNRAVVAAEQSAKTQFSLLPWVEHG